MNKRYAVISDVHGNNFALEAVLSDISKRKINRIFNLGDSLYGPLNPSITADILMDHNITHIQGNCDRMLYERTGNPSSAILSVKNKLSTAHINWLSLLPKTLIVDDLLLCHGTPDSDEIYLLEDMSIEGGILKDSASIMGTLQNNVQNVIVCGHSHIPRVVYLPNDKLVVNPGSVGLPAYLDELPIPHKMVSGSPHAKYTILEKMDNEWLVEQISVPYDWTSAANLALQNNRQDWFRALTSGML
ncbi:metallophosphoesterase family protein [Lysinibacillus parviboronicapiens]|uniref:metallophosphoesterase family protein n=1 Tax=Lysinibacillus parviboronicapiens TaxID=436516 RepID=UPI000D3430CF|nr:metallophosphoesterase family protein [Lysinibacillus parviboronicapiens]